MIQRGAGQPTWALSPYEVSVSYGQPGQSSSYWGQGADWFGPLAPITPLAPPQVSGRQWDYPSGYNLATTPRIYEPLSFHTLRGLAEGYDLLRIVIETRKDQVARLVWNIGPRNKQPGNDPRLAALRQFFARPDGLHTFGDWLRLLLEELFVIDAPALYLQRDRAGRLSALLPLDGATIKPVIDDWGRTPQPYAENGEMVYPVAYQQVLKGYPAVDYSLRDIIYRPRNIRVNHAYGFSPVEQIVTSVNIALRRQMYLLDYFTQGNIPDSLIGVPSLATWMDKAHSAQQRIVSQKHYERDILHWHSGVHLFVAQDLIWNLCDLTQVGVSVSCWNHLTLGIEMVGDYAAESFESGPGAQVRDNAVAALAVLHRKLELRPDGFRLGVRGLHFHKECRRDHHDCPGRNVVKADVVARVLAQMAALEKQPRREGAKPVQQRSQQ